MAITFQLPQEIEQRLRDQFPDLDQAAKEAALVELYRHGGLSPAELGGALGLSRFEVDALLNRHRVTEDLPTPEEHEAQLAKLRELLSR